MSRAKVTSDITVRELVYLISLHRQASTAKGTDAAWCGQSHHDRGGGLGTLLLAPKGWGDPSLRHGL